jgi:hypothetical protein
LCGAGDKAGKAGWKAALGKVFERGDEAATEGDVRGCVGVRVGGWEGGVQGGGDVHGVIGERDLESWRESIF